jgi:catechol 2,3-dioxygenase-like lactoylglutathione lyase family enzyme
VTESESPLGSIQMAAVTLYVSDLDAALGWYDTKLGLRPMSESADGHRYAAFSIGGAIVVLEPIEAALEPAALGSENTTLNVVIDRDPEKVRTELLDRGVSCGELVASPNFISFLVRDPYGNRFYMAHARTHEARRATEEATAAMSTPTSA